MAFTHAWRFSHVIRTGALLLLLSVLQACSSQDDTGSEKSKAQDAASIQAEIIQKSAADPTPEEASRFLMQATFGPKESEITALDASNLDAWLTNQFALPRQSHYDYVWNLRTQGVDIDNFSNTHAIESFWKQAVTGQDQLRQRTTWALSQIFVVGDSDNIRNSAYYDVLAENAFGNYRTLLEKVTLSPAMGQWLSMIGNQKEDLATGRLPDENYAREVMQLFSIGLWQLNADGSRKLDASNQPIPTYTQDDIRGMAKVLTGWSYANCNPVQESWYCIDSARDGYYRIYDNTPNHSPGTLPLDKTQVYRDVTKQMTAMAAYHSTSEKKIVGGVILPAGRTAEQDLKDGLDTLFNHPNVGPFIGRLLIQRLVKSNPSPAYIGRISAVFANNGQGVRGDLKAVIKAILLDPEARDIAQVTTTTSGKLREPVLRLSHYLRAFTVPNGATPRYDINPWWMDEVFAQRPMSARSVFNFYSPSYLPAGEMSTNNLVGPEFQIYHESTLVDSHNFIEYWVTNDPSADPTDPPSFKHNYAAYTALASNPTALVDKLDLIMTGKTMSAETKATITTAVTNVPAGTDQAQNRFEMAIMLFQIAPDYLIQK
jgi:uncharacterized protein (DUF1800 family)